MNELLGTCKAYREELGELYNMSYEEQEERAERGEIAGFGDWLFREALDYEYTVSSNGEYLGARIYVALGGPTVWIDTRNQEVRGVWGSDRADIWLPSEICNELDEYLEEEYKYLK